MALTLTVNLERAIESARLLDNHPGGKEMPAGDMTGRQAELQQHCQTLQAVINKLNQFCETLFTEHKQEIAKLAVEIARKILFQQVEQGDYKIETIIAEAIKNIPSTPQLAVHLNPADLARCEQLLGDEPAGPLAGIKFVADANVGRAECLVESPKGTIESRLEGHLEQVAKALEKAE